MDRRRDTTGLKHLIAEYLADILFSGPLGYRIIENGIAIPIISAATAGLFEAFDDKRN